MPIFNSKGNFIGVVGYSLDFFEGDLRALTTDQGVITIHKNKNAILKTLTDINKDPSVKLITDIIKDHKDALIDNYVASTGDLNYASVVSFNTLRDSSRWSMIVTVPKKSALEPLFRLQFAIITTAS